MLQVGTILHKAKSGRLIIRLSREVRAGSFLVDDKGRKLGKVVELIGPARAPYASVVPSTDKVGRDGDPAYTQG